MKTMHPNLVRVIFVVRLIIAFIWLWSAFDSWFLYPHEESLNLLRATGLTSHTVLWFIASCSLDLVMGIATLLFSSRMLWLLQMVLVSFYSVVIALALPEFLNHPFAPIIKNLAVLGCLYVLLETSHQHRP